MTGAKELAWGRVDVMAEGSVRSGDVTCTAGGEIICVPSG